MRYVVGAGLAIAGAAVTLVSPWQAWYNGRHGSTYKFWEVFGTGITGSLSGIMDSVFLIFLITAIACVAGVLMRSRLIVAVAGAVALGFSILWMVRQGNAAGELVIGGNGRGIGPGLAYALGGSVLMLIGALVMTERPRMAAAPADTTAGTTAGTTVGTTRAYDSGRTDAQSATAQAPVASTTTGTGTGTTLTPEEQAMIDKLDEPPPPHG